MAATSTRPSFDPAPSPRPSSAAAAAAAASGSGSIGASSRLNRVPTLTFPPLHLGSFNGLTADSFPSPPPSGTPDFSTGLASPRESHLGPRGGGADRRPGSRGSVAPSGASTEVGSAGGTSRPGQGAGRSETTVVPRESFESRSPLGLAPVRSRESSRSSASLGRRGPPSFPAPNMSLPPLPTLPPISPLGLMGSQGQFASLQDATSLPDLRGARSPSAPARRPSDLEIDIPPAAFTDKDTSSAVLRNSPGLPRRRTLVQSPVPGPEQRRSVALDDVPMLSKQNEAPPVEAMENLSMPDPRPTGTRDDPTSPTRRSLPRPPSDRPALEIITALPPRQSRLPPAATQALQLPQSQSQIPPPRPSAAHRATPSASTLPIIAGLADAGPYSFSKPAPVGLGRPPAPKQEEVCLECMMRDRDLADVDVSAPEAWARASDAGMQELSLREETLLKSLGPRAADATSSDESSGPSPPSTTNSLEDAEARRQVAASKRRAAVRARKQEADHRVLREVGWRGFKWEEGSAGEGLPRGFRGTRGGGLTEEGIKAVMIKYLLVLDIAAEAKRVGFYPEPSDSGIPSMSSHEGGPVAGGSGFTSRTGPLAGSWDSRGALPPGPRQASLPQASRGPSTPISAPAHIAAVKPSPSSPADLSAIAIGRARAHTQSQAPSRPMTHFIPEREPVRGTADSQSLRLRPVNTNLSTGAMDRWGAGGAGEELDAYTPISPADSGMRPFSFAVRAGAVAQGHAQGSEGHGRKSFFGRWGGSVTSLFGGSQGGSGSMMDMHLGLDNERRNRTSSFNVHSQRAVSLASPTRPSFFSRDSRDSTAIERERPRERVDRPDRAGKSLSNSRLSQVYRSGDDDDASEHGQRGQQQQQSSSPAETPVKGKGKKEKGIKGLLNKMKPRKKSVSHTPPAMPYEQYIAQMPQGGPQQAYPRAPHVQLNPNSPAHAAQRQDQAQAQALAPPPPLSYLVGRGEGTHNRNRSGSSSSMLTDNSGPGAAGVGAGGVGMRSVSAPLGDASSGSQSVSPSSSRFDRAQRERERDSYGSGSARRRGSGYGSGLVPGQTQGQGAREAIDEEVERQSGRPSMGMGERGESSSGNEWSASGQTPGLAPAYRHNNKMGTGTMSSLSTSSVVETPPPTHSPLSYPLPVPVAQGVGKQVYGPGQGYPGPTSVPKHVQAMGEQLSPNRFKNLPPLPPFANAGRSGEGEMGAMPASPWDRDQDAESGTFGAAGAGTPRGAYGGGGREDAYAYQPQQHSRFEQRPRASFDPADAARERERAMGGGVAPGAGRMAKSMYVGMGMGQGHGQGLGQGSLASLGEVLPGHAQGYAYGAGPGTGTGYGYGNGYEQGVGYGSRDGPGVGMGFEGAERYVYGQQAGGGPGAGQGAKGMGTGTVGKKKGLKAFFGGSKAGRLA